MRVTGFWSAVGLTLVGFVIADLLIHPAGTQALGNSLVSVENATAYGMLGQGR